MKQTKLFKANLPQQVKEGENNYKITLPKYSRYVTNISNVLFFEYHSDDEKELEHAELVITIRKFQEADKEIDIPAGFSYLCSYYDPLEKVYLFVYFQDTMSSIVGNFMGMFGGSYKNFF